MSAHSDDLKEFERQLAACAPAVAGLDAGAMLFAAGRASVRPGLGRFLWPGLSLSLAVLVGILGTRLAQERGERLALMRQPHDFPAATRPGPDAPEPPSWESERWSPGLLEVHRALEQGRDALPAPLPVRVDLSAASPEPRVMRSHALGGLLDP